MVYVNRNVFGFFYYISIGCFLVKPVIRSNPSKSKEVVDVSTRTRV